MKKILDFADLLKESEQIYRQKQGQTKNQREDHPLFNALMDFLNQPQSFAANAKRFTFSKLAQLEPREIYTLKKKVLDQLAGKLFNQRNYSFFENFILLKLTPDATHSFSEFLKTDQIAYIFFDAQILSALKFTKNSQILDPIDGTVYKLNSFFQNLEKKFYPAEVEGISYQIEIPLSYGAVVLDKIKQ